MGLAASNAATAAATLAASPAAAAKAPASEAGGRPGLKDCTSRACAGVLDTFKRTLHRAGGSGSSAATSGAAGGAPSPAAAGAAGQHTAEVDTAAAGASGRGSSGDVEPGGASASASSSSGAVCPPDTWELGRATWTFLHSVAAYYPESPSERQQALMRGMMEGLAEFYPCEVCREHLREQVAANPPRVATAKELNLWLCGIHNEVNEMLGKPLFDCTRLAERWRDGPPDGSCD